MIEYQRRIEVDFTNETLDHYIRILEEQGFIIDKQDNLLVRDSLEGHPFGFDKKINLYLPLPVAIAYRGENLPLGESPYMSLVNLHKEFPEDYHGLTEMIAKSMLEVIPQSSYLYH